MLSIRNRGIAFVAVAMLALVGCGKDQPAETGNDAWTTKGNDLQMKLGEVKRDFEAINTQLYTMPAAASTDSAVVAERTAIENILNEDMTKVSQIETMLNEHATTREKLKTDGDNDAYKSAWTAEEPKYNEAMTTLDSIQKRNADLKTRVNNLASIAASPDGTAPGADTSLSRGPSMPEMKDSGSGGSGNIDTGAKIR